MRKRWLCMLLAVMMLWALVGCNDAKPDDGKDSPTTTTTAPEQTVAPLTLMEGEAPEGSYRHVDDTVEDTNYTVVLKANLDLTNLCFLELGADEPVVTHTLHVRPSLDKGQYWAIETYLNDAVPNRGVVCTDKDGKTYYYAFTYSMKGDDSPSISLTALHIETLSEERLTEIETYLNDVENNGFVSMNEYTCPEEVSLHDALYNGAGIGARDWSEEEKQEYMEITGQTDEEEAFLWPIFRFPRADLEALILEKLGIPLSEFELSMTYIEELDAYFTSHTDSSYQTVEVLHGWLEGGEGGLYNVSYKLAWGKIGHVTLRLTKDGYQFVSNRYTAE